MSFFYSDGGLPPGCTDREISEHFCDGMYDNCSECGKWRKLGDDGLCAECRYAEDQE